MQGFFVAGQKSAPALSDQRFSKGLGARLNSWKATKSTVRRTPIWNRLLPRQVDNIYRGHRLALWLFALLVLVKVIMSLNSIFNGDSVASTADGIPLDTFAPAGAQTVVSLFALTAFSRLMICLLCILVLVRYRAMVPLMFAFLLLEHLGRRLVLQFLPIPRTGTSPGSAINLVLLAVMIVGLGLSLWSPRNRQARE